MHFHFGDIGVIFIAVTLWLLCFSTFIGFLYYARPNVANLFGDTGLPILKALNEYTAMRKKEKK